MWQMAGKNLRTTFTLLLVATVVVVACSVEQDTSKPNLNVSESHHHRHVRGSPVDNRELFSSDHAKTLREQIRSFPRYNWARDKVSPNLFGCPDDKETFTFDDCSPADYSQSLAVIAFPGIFLAILIGTAQFWFCAGRYCCGCCGGRYPSKSRGCPTCCCVDQNEEFEGYEKRHVVYWRMFILVVLVLALIGAAIGFYGNTSFTNGSKDSLGVLSATVDKIVDTTDDIASGLTNINSALQALLANIRGESSSSAGESDELRKALEDAQIKAEDVKDQFATIEGYRAKWDDIRLGVMMSGLGVALLLFVIGMIGSLLSYPGLMKAIAWFGFIPCCFMFLSFGIHEPFSFVVADMCHAIDISGRGSNPMLDQFIDCSDSTAFEETRTQADEMRTSLRDDVFCTVFDGFVEVDLIDSTTQCKEVADMASLSEDVVKAKCYDVDGNVVEEKRKNPGLTAQEFSIEACASGGSICDKQNTPVFDESGKLGDGSKLRSMKEFCSDLNSAHQLTLDATALMDDEILPLLDCVWVNQAFVDLFDALCVDFFIGSRYISISSVIEASLLVFLIIGAIKGMKRFNNTNWEGSMDMELDTLRPRTATNYAGRKGPILGTREDAEKEREERKGDEKKGNKDDVQLQNNPLLDAHDYDPGPGKY